MVVSRRILKEFRRAAPTRSTDGHVFPSIRRAGHSPCPPLDGPDTAGARSRSRAASSSGLKPSGPPRPGRRPAVAADQVEPVGPAAVGGGDRVVDVVEQDRDPRREAHRARVGGRRPLVERDRIDDRDLLAPVVGEHPAVLGVRLADVDDEERDLVTVAVVELLQLAQLAAEGRSGVRAEDERDRALAREVGEPDALAARAVRLGSSSGRSNGNAGSPGAQLGRHQPPVERRRHHVSSVSGESAGVSGPAWLAIRLRESFAAALLHLRASGRSPSRRARAGASA